MTILIRIKPLRNFPSPIKVGLSDPNWVAPDGWPRTNTMKAMRDHGGGEKLLRELRGRRIKTGPMAERKPS